MNEISCCGAHYLRNQLLNTNLFAYPFEERHPFLKEFVLKPLVSIEAIQNALYKAGFFGAVATEEGLVSFCVTEKRTKEECDALVAAVATLKDGCADK